MAKLLGKAAANKRIRALYPAAFAAARAQLKKEVDNLTAAIKRNAPFEEGELQASVRNFETPDRELSYRIIADAKDDKSRYIGHWVEHGHTAPDGTPVPARPFFFPTYRAHKKGMQRRMRAAAKRAVVKAWNQ